MQTSATIKYVRISPKKVKSMARMLVGLSAQDAIDRLRLYGNKAEQVLAHSILSAVSNAKNNARINPATLQVKTIETGKGPHFKRFQPVSRGIAHSIKKRTSHIKVTLESIETK